MTDQLLKTGQFVVTAITRPGSTGKLPDGVHVSRVDYSGDDNTALIKALKGQQALIITLAVMAPPDTILKLARAAAEAGVSYILPNWFGHDAANDSLCNDSWLSPSRDKNLAEINNLGVSSYLLLCCNFWYEFSLAGGPDRFGFDFQKRSFTWFDDGKEAFNVTTWPQVGRALANLLSLKELPDDEKDKSATLSQFRNQCIYVSSFRLSQRDMFESVKRVTKTTDADWTINHESSEQRWKDGTATLKQGNFGTFTKMLYSRMYFPNGGGDIETIRGLHNGLLDLPIENLDEWTATAVRMGEKGEVATSH